MSITHSTVTAEPNDPAYDVSADAWNDDHAITHPLVLENITVSATYVVWLDTGVYYARHSDTGVVTSNAVPETLVNACFTAGGAGTKVVLREATYTLAAAGIAFTANSQVLEGMGRGSFIDGDALATTVHAINLDGFNDCIIRNLSVQTQDGGGKTCYCIYMDDADDFTIEGVIIVNSDVYGIYFGNTTTTTGGVITKCVFIDTDYDSIGLAGHAARPHLYLNITENTVYKHGGYGVYAYNIRNSVIAHNVFVDGYYPSILTDGSADNNVIDGNICLNNTRDQQIRVQGDFNTVANNVCASSDDDGILIRNAYGVKVTGNLCFQNNEHGIHLENADNCVVANNICYENDFNDTATYDGIYVDADSTDNQVTGNHCYANDRNGIQCDGDRNNIIINYCITNGDYGIELAATADSNVVKNNRFYNNTIGVILDGGTNTRTHSLVIPFTGGGNAAGVRAAQFIHADASAKGWKIDAVDEWTLSKGYFPLECHQVLRIRVMAVGLAAPGAGNSMLMELLANGRQKAEPWNTENISVVNKVSTVTNFAVGDGIEWIFTSADDADIGDLVGGDSIEVKAKYNALVGADIATNATFQCVEFDYV